MQIAILISFSNISSVFEHFFKTRTAKNLISRACASTGCQKKNSKCPPGCQKSISKNFLVVHLVFGNSKKQLFAIGMPPWFGGCDIPSTFKAWQAEAPGSSDQHREDAWLGIGLGPQVGSKMVGFGNSRPAFEIVVDCSAIWASWGWWRILRVFP